MSKCVSAAHLTLTAKVTDPRVRPRSGGGALLKQIAFGTLL